MARLTLDIPDDTHRKLKTLAAYFGMTMKDFLISRALSSPERPPSQAEAPTIDRQAERLDDLLFSSQSSFKLNPENWDAFCAALEAPPAPNADLKKLMSMPSLFDEQ